MNADLTERVRVLRKKLTHAEKRNADLAQRLAAAEAEVLTLRTMQVARKAWTADVDRDYKSDHGEYFHASCGLCGSAFYGGKGRVVCAVCKPTGELLAQTRERLAAAEREKERNRLHMESWRDAAQGFHDRLETAFNAVNSDALAMTHQTIGSYRTMLLHGMRDRRTWPKTVEIIDAARATGGQPS